MELVKKGWDTLHIQERPDVDSSQNYIRVFKSRRVRWAGRVARKGLRRYVQVHLVGKREIKSSLGRRKCRRVGDIKLDLIETHLEGSGTSILWLRLGKVAGSDKRGDRPSNIFSIKYYEFLD